MIWTRSFVNLYVVSKYISSLLFCCVRWTDKLQTFLQYLNDKLNKYRWWWWVRPSFTFSTLTTSQTTGNGLAQVTIYKWSGKEKSCSCCQTSNWPLVATTTSVCLVQDFVSLTMKVSSGWVQGNIVVMNHLSIKVLEIYYVGLSVRTSEVCRLRQKLSWVQWTLWRDKVLFTISFLFTDWQCQVIALQTNGEILVFSLLCPNGQLMYKSEPYTVVMYKVGYTRYVTKN